MQKTTTNRVRVIAVALTIVVTLGLAAKLTHSYLVEKNEQLVHSVAQTLLPALLANDQQQVAEVLKSLESYPGIERIDLISSEGASIASLERVGTQLNPAATDFALASADGETEQLQVAAPITFDSLILANLHIAVNLWPTYLHIMSWLGVLFMVPSAIYVLIKRLRVNVRFERLTGSSYTASGEPSDHFDLHKIMQETFDEAHIQVEYQPIHRIKDGGVFGFELVVCWLHPSGQTLYFSPSDFINLTEKWGIFLPVSEWLLQTACQCAASWQRMYGPLVMSFNISYEQLIDPAFVQKVREICKFASYPIQLIEFEINESELIKQKNAKQMVREFLGQGLSLTIDHFGLTRQSSDFIGTIPAQKIKLDSKLMVNFEKDNVIQNLVKSLIEKAAAHDVLVMSEGLNRRGHLAMFKQIGIIQGQGPAISVPLKPEVFLQYLKQTKPMVDESSICHGFGATV